MSRLKQLIESNETPGGRRLDVFIQLLIVGSLISFSIETLPDLSARSRLVLGWIEAGTITIFSVEYLLRVAVADNKLPFIFSFFGIVDLLAILPFFVARGIDLRSLRAVRLLRLFRALKMVRYSRAIRRLHKALSIIKEELVLFLSAMLLLLFFSATGIYYFEHEAQPEAFSSVFHSLWWAVTTLTTVGYGDVYPVTVGGRLFTFVVLVIGLGVVAAPCGLLASALSEARRLENPSADAESPGKDS